MAIDMSDFKIPVDVLVYRVASRLGLIDPKVDKYYGKGSPADLKIQSFAKRVFPENPWVLDEALWSTGRQASKGGRCYPTYPNHHGCIFEEICPKKYVEFDPSAIGIEVGGIGKGRTLSSDQKRGLTDKQKRFSAFVQQLQEQGVRGEAYRRKVAEWFKTNP